MHDVWNSVSLHPVVSLSQWIIRSAAESLAKQYDTDISSAFPSQFLSFRSCFHSQLSTKSTILKVAHLLLIDYHALSSTFSDVCTANMLLLTLPVTVATCERSFSKLKLIKNFLRSTMSQEHLGDMAVLPRPVLLTLLLFAQEKARKRKSDEWRRRRRNGVSINQSINRFIEKW